MTHIFTDMLNKSLYLNLNIFCVQGTIILSQSKLIEKRSQKFVRTILLVQLYFEIWVEMERSMGFGEISRCYWLHRKYKRFQNVLCRRILCWGNFYILFLKLIEVFWALIVGDWNHFYYCSLQIWADLKHKVKYFS